MNFENFETLLGKNISAFKDNHGNEFENKLFGKNFFYTKNENINKSLVNMKFNAMTILTNEEDRIRSIAIHFYGNITQEFYSELINTYGLPDEIKVIKERVEISSDIIDDENFIQQVKKNRIEITDGTFDEKPIFITWVKNDFSINIIFKHKQKTFDIVFETRLSTN
jgi:hypothetical protein